MKRVNMLIAGQEHPPGDDRYFDVIAPAQQSVMAQVAEATKADVDLAVRTAKRGFSIWSGLTPSAREACLLRAAELIKEHGEARLLDTLIDESGSAISKARFEIAYTVDLLRTAAGEVRRLYGDTFPNDNPQRISMVLREPLGVVAVISPYNAPLSLLTKMAAFPLAAGNSVVIKPSEETPQIAIEFVRILLEAGFPPSSVNVITGTGATSGAALVEHKGVNCIALTGSSATGQKVGASAMKRMVKAQLELGGKSAALVLRDVDPVKAANVVAQGIFTHGGQICMANSRVVVEDAIYDQFIGALKLAAENLNIGDLRNPDTVYGPLINSAAVSKVQHYVDQALEQGARLLTGGNVRHGLVYEPTVLLNTPGNCGAWREELFGPVTSVVKVSSLEEGIEAVNDSEYGLSSCVLTKNLNWAMQAAKQIDAGAVHIGMHAFQSNALAPIGGSKLSGVGRSGGAYSTEEFTDVKWISIEMNETL